MENKKTATTDPTRPDGLCMTPGCGCKANWRGICLKCRTKAKEYMKSAGKTWDDLEKKGLVGPAPERGPRGKSESAIARDEARYAWFGKAE